MKRQTVAIAYVHPTELSAYFMQSMDDLRTWDLAHGRHLVGTFRQVSSANITNARNDLVTRFLNDCDADWLWFLDADMVFEPDTLHQLLVNADPVKAPIVGGLCFGMDGPSLFPTLYFLVRDPDTGEAGMVRPPQYDADTLVQVNATGAACLLIHRSVLLAMRKAVDEKHPQFSAAYPFFMEKELDGKPSGEDITFCLRAQILGFNIHVDTGVAIGHHKSIILTEQMFLAQQKEPTP